MIAIWAVAGMLAGMLVNLGADLLPSRQPLRKALLCPDCGERRPSVRWPAALSFLLERHRPYCNAPLPWRALGAELALAGIWAVGWHLLGPSPQLWLFSLHTAVFALVFVVDLEHRLVLNRVTMGGGLLALAGSLVWKVPPPLHGVLGGALGFLILLVIALAKPGAMGMGDVKLAGLIGLVVGFPGVLPALAVGIIAGGVGAAAMLLTGRARRGSYLPYAPFLVTGAMVVMVQASRI